MRASALWIWTLLGLLTLAGRPAPAFSKPFEIGGVYELSEGSDARGFSPNALTYYVR